MPETTTLPRNPPKSTKINKNNEKMEEINKITRNQFRLFKKVIELSESNDWESAKKEWHTTKIIKRDNDDLGTCLCGKYPIKEEIQMFNDKTKYQIIVGNCCIKRFFDMKDFSKVFNAIRQNKVNGFMINDMFEKNIISVWERDFMMDLWRKRFLTERQSDIFNRIKKKIIRNYKGGEWYEN